MAFKPEQSVVLLGTSRRDGNTLVAVKRAVAGKSVEIVELSQLDFSAYDYEHRNAGDEFIPLIESIAAKPLWILATPVYWYTMSAQLKIFVDRLSDLVTIRKDLGRRLRGISVGVIASGIDPQLPAGFESPFRLSCDYLGMNYLGTHYARFEKDDQPSPCSLSELAAAWIS